MPDDQSPGSKYQKGVLYDIPVIDLKTDPNQPRKTLDPQALEELTASIKQVGVLQPVLFRPGDAGYLYLVAGERRFAAAKNAGLLTIPGMYVDGSPAEIALVENLLRQDLTAVEEAEALQRLKDDQQYTDEQLSGVIGRARTTLSDILLISRLPEEIRDEARGDRKLSKSTLIEIARKKQSRGMVTAWEKYKEKQAKAAAGKQRREKIPPTPEELIAWVGATKTKIAAIDPADWEEAERDSLMEALEELSAAIRIVQSGDVRLA